MLLERITRFLHDVGNVDDKHVVGILVTAGHEGKPHATYMGTIASPALDRLLTMTAPESQKVVNILENPCVEWLFADEDEEEVLYVWGKARVVEEPTEVEEAWRNMPDKSRAYFLSFQGAGMKFLIFETKIYSFELRIPRQNLRYRLERDEIERLVSRAGQAQ